MRVKKVTLTGGFLRARRRASTFPGLPAAPVAVGGARPRGALHTPAVCCQVQQRTEPHTWDLSAFRKGQAICGLEPTWRIFNDELRAQWRVP